MTEGPLGAYRVMTANGEFGFDPAQALAVEKLQSLHNALRHYRPSTGRAGWKARLGLARRAEEPPQGLYLFGPVGTGKSMLMDLFFSLAPIEAKRRVHFHAFMQDVQKRLHALRTAPDAPEDAVRHLAGEIASEAWLLCFDEFHIVNIADAMILGRLFETLFDHGTIVVATSNWGPDTLYENGLQRENVLPFIALLKQRLDILHLDGGHDHRRRRGRADMVYHTPLGAAATAALDKAFADVSGGARPKQGVLPVRGRALKIPCEAGGVARFAFSDLCEKALGPADYLAIAGAYHTLVVDGIPRMDASRRNEARRFMTLIDALYEHKVKLIAAAEVAPEGLYREGHGAREFQRTISRLIEMRSVAYRELPHIPADADTALPIAANEST